MGENSQTLNLIWATRGSDVCRNNYWCFTLYEFYCATVSQTSWMYPNNAPGGRIFPHWLGWKEQGYRFLICFDIFHPEFARKVWHLMPSSGSNLRFLIGNVLRNLNMYSFPRLCLVCSTTWSILKSAGLWEVSQQAGHLSNSPYHHSMTLRSIQPRHA